MKEIRALLGESDMRGPSGHSFSSNNIFSAGTCLECNLRVFLFETPCKCLVCGALAHRACLSRASLAGSLPCCTEVCLEETRGGGRAQFAATLAAEESPESTTDEGGHGACIPSLVDPMVDPSYKVRRALRASTLVGGTFLGSVVGIASGGVLLGGGGILAVGLKASMGTAGGITAYIHQRRKALLQGVVLPPTSDMVPVFWAERARELRAQSVFKFVASSFGHEDEQGILKLEGCALEEKVSFFVTKLLLNSQTVPGLLWVHLREAFEERAARPSEGHSQIFDALGLTHELIMAVFSYHSVLGASDEIAISTINSIDDVVFGELYGSVFGTIIEDYHEVDSGLEAKFQTLGDAQLRPQSEAAMCAMRSASNAKTALNKMRCFSRLVECIGTIDGTPLSADELIPALTRHVILSAGSVRVHAELAFVDAFCRDELLLLGREGYALTSLRACVQSLDAASDESQLRRALEKGT